MDMPESDLAEDLTAQGLCGVMAASLTAAGVPASVAAALAQKACVPAVGVAQDVATEQKAKAKRKVSAYARTFGREYRLIRSKHPRLKHIEVTKRAHRAAKRSLKATK